MRNCVLNFWVDLGGKMKGGLHQWKYILRIPRVFVFELLTQTFPANVSHEVVLPAQ